MCTYVYYAKDDFFLCAYKLTCAIIKENKKKLNEFNSHKAKEEYE